MQVYCNNRFVGNFSYPVPDGCRYFKVAKFNADVDLFMDEGADFTTAVTKEFVFEIKRRGVRVQVDHGTFMRGSEADYVAMARKSYNIPDDAHCEDRQDPRMDGVTKIFAWDALDLDQDTYEELFDHPSFEPV